MDLRELEAVVAVHEHGSFSAAAGELFISQPALTRRVALLERELGVRIFVRSARGVSLTDAGRALIEPARRALQEAHSIHDALNLVRGGVRGTLHLTGVSNLSVGEFASLIAEFHETAPDVDVRVSAAVSTAAAVGSVEAGSADLAIVDLPVESDAVAVTEVWDDDYLAVYSDVEPPDPYLSTYPRVSAELLRDRPLIHLPVAHYPRQHGMRMFEMLGVAPVSTIETQHCELLVLIARAGRGVAVVPRAVAMRAQASGAHVAQPPVAITRTVGLARRRSDKSPTVRRFLELAESRRAPDELAG